MGGWAGGRDGTAGLDGSSWSRIGGAKDGKGGKAGDFFCCGVKIDSCPSPPLLWLLTLSCVLVLVLPDVSATPLPPTYSSCDQTTTPTSMSA